MQNQALLCVYRKKQLLVSLALSAAARVTAGPDSSTDAYIESQGVEPAKEKRGTRRVGVLCKELPPNLGE
jgi:hypothetical protein